MNTNANLEELSQTREKIKDSYSRNLRKWLIYTIIGFSVADAALWGGIIGYDIAKDEYSKNFQNQNSCYIGE